METGESIRAITLDVGGTLIEPWPSVGAVYEEVARRFGCRGIDPARLSQAFGRAWNGRRTFNYSRTAWRQLVEETFDGVNGFVISDACFDAIYGQFGRACAWRLYDDVRPFLEFACGHNIPLAVVSNWDERLRGLLGELNLLSAFESVIISHEAGCHKPAAEIFHRAADQLKLRPEAILHVGDSEQEDFQGARRAGFQSRWLRRSGGGGTAGTIQSLAELEKVAF